VQWFKTNTPIKKEYAKQKLRSFCEQYGFPPLIAPSTKHKRKKYRNKKIKSYKPYNKYYRSKNSKNFLACQGL